MSIISQEEVLKVLISYNVWWRTGKVPQNAMKEMKRTAYYEANKAFLNREIRRFIILTGAQLLVMVSLKAITKSLFISEFSTFS